MKVLLVKMSSLGDIVHTLPAVEDASRCGARFDWVVEEDYRALAARSVGADHVLTVAFRRWRRGPIAGLQEVKEFRRDLQRRRYDLVLDAQGLLKSAAVGCWARANERVGFDASTARERAATLGYQRRLRVPWGEHAITRSRRLFAAALGYDMPATEPVFGLALPTANTPSPEEHCVLLAHGTTWTTKLWPETFWADVARRAASAGFTPVLPWVNGERARAERIAAAAPEARVCPPMDLENALSLVEGTRGVIGVDSGLAHFAAAVGRPTVMVFGPTDHRLTGCKGPCARNLSTPLACSPCHSRRCRNPASSSMGNGVIPCLAAVTPHQAWSTLAAMMDREQPQATRVESR